MGLLIAIQNQPGAIGVPIIFVVGIVAFLLVAILQFVFFITLGKPWMQAFMSGCPISLFELLGMQMRRVKPREIIPHGVAAAQAGFPIPWRELERAYLQGADIEKVSTAYVASMKRELGFSFSDLVDAERDSKLEKLLQS